MPRNMSFFLTTDQIRNRTKTVTRRKGWAFLKPGEIVNACVKCQGLKKGEKIEKICQIRIMDNRPERLDAIPWSDCAKEGFPTFAPPAFILMFCRHMGGNGRQFVNRIEFEYIRSSG